MGINSTEVSYAFGQLGSVYVTTADAVKPPTGKVFVAITSLDNVKFDASGGLIAEDENKYFNTEHAAGDLADGSETTDEGSGGVELPATQKIPTGVTVYGRWTEIDPTSGTCIAYIGD